MRFRMSKGLRMNLPWACATALVLLGGLAAAQETAPHPKSPPTGLLYFASYQQRDNSAPATNPHLVGAVFTIYWSDVERQEGVFDWSALDRRIAVWTQAGKKVALRIMWSSSGNWPEPAAKHPTPQFVLAAGAVTVRSESSKTEIPLVWDPVYRRHAARFLREVARKFDGDPKVLFVDATPGAETNPYRFRRINVAEPDFKQRFLGAAAGDGRRYSHALWLETVKQGVDDAVAAFRKTPLLVTLNHGSLDGPEQFQAIGEHCVGRGCFVGQNGLNARSYGADSPRRRAFREWGGKTRLYFEMVDASGGGTGSLLEVMKAAERVGCNYLGVYAVDVLRGTRGQPNFDPAYEEALAYGARVMGKPASPAGASSSQSLETAHEPRALALGVPPSGGSRALPPEGGTPNQSLQSGPQGFRLQGERWTYGDGDLAMGGILLKPEGKGPFAGILISHGLGGSAESFALNKAREMVKWGFVCIAPSYTHNARAVGDRRGGAGKGRGDKSVPDAVGGSRSPVSNYGASEENIRRARKCVEILRSLPEVDGHRIGAYGHSMGGFVTIGLAATAPELLKAAAITGSGVAPGEGFPAPSVKTAAKVRTPFLILHGGSDPVVRPEQSASLKQVLDGNHVPNERHIFEGEGHPIDQSRREEVFRRMREWFGQHGVVAR